MCRASVLSALTPNTTLFRCQWQDQQGQNRYTTEVVADVATPQEDEESDKVAVDGVCQR